MGKYNNYQLDGVEPNRLKNCYCIICKHFLDWEKGTCMAFPNGIPQNFNMENKERIIEHVKIVDGQVGDSIFELSDNVNI